MITPGPTRSSESSSSQSPLVGSSEAPGAGEPSGKAILGHLPYETQALMKVEIPITKIAFITCATFFACSSSMATYKKGESDLYGTVHVISSSSVRILTLSRRSNSNWGSSTADNQPETGCGEVCQEEDPPPF
ncbi:hypothetical protein BV898_05500 [Hypsibius exemplaris]|uniref:Uncharacterized protein n=1 Tax=Hypsibius exemplaris TaxID=2072580 RepID=A0A1W0WZ64_HYPEX|nr:hypothetical protein BV898_05500 [Hypsibius exemplaris]